MRHLASIKRVLELNPIEGKDRIELAAIDGWHVIVKKGEFSVGDQCVYVEIDSVMPKKPEFEFLAKNNYRIKTIKMAGCISQGICFPLSILPSKAYSDDEDVTTVLEVTQYEPTQDKEHSSPGEIKKSYPKFLMRSKPFRKIFCSKKERHGFPSFVSKTDETRIQNMPWILKDKSEFIATEKVDGQSGTFALVRHKSKIPFMKDKFEYMVCSRNNRLFKPDVSSYWSVSKRYHIEDVLRNMIGANEWVCIQGECVAPGVQKNKYKVDKADLYVFNIIYPTGRLGSTEAKLISDHWGLKFVPIVDEHFVLPDTVDELLEYAHGKSALVDGLREGIVFRSKDGKTSFKAVDPLFLLKYDE